MTEKKRILILGKNNISINCTKFLLKEDRVQVVGCCPNNNDNGKDSWQKSLYKYCDEKNIEIIKFEKIKSKFSLNILKKMNLDFIFSFQYDQIISQEVIDIPRNGAINLHFSPLPKYRGVYPIAWALINNEKKYGVTLHYMDPGIDTGDIISQKMFNIDTIKNARELYNKCESVGTKIFKKSLNTLLDGSIGGTPQDNSKGVYYSKGSIDFNKCNIDFNNSTLMLYNWIRAMIFPPLQFPKFQFNGYWLEVRDANPIYRKNKFEKPGTIVYSENGKFLFSTQDCYIELITTKYEKGK